MHFLSKSLFILSTILLLSYSAKSQNQVTVTAVVFPPYSTDFSYYIDNPNKIQVTFLNTTNQPLDVYVQGRLTGDNGVEIKTEPSWHPSLPVTLYPGIPFHLSQDNIGDVFSSDHLLYVGTSQEELTNMGGLPEGSYQFCFSVFDFNSGNLLSNEDMGCSNIIILTYVDPPVVLNPICGDTIVPTTPQNILISWTPAVGASPNIKYRFIMAEMHPGDRNPNDALASAAPPYFLEKEDLTVPQLLIGPSDPPLEEGRSYAFIVQAYDPDNQVIFNNNGTSEACWFNYKHPLEIQPVDSIANPDLGIDDFINDFELIPNTKISGTLHYKLASLAQGGAATGSQTHATQQGSGTSGNSNSGINYNQTGSNNSSGGNSANYSHFGFNFMNGFQTTSPTAGMVYKPPFGTGTINESVYSINNAEPLRNTTIRLVVRYSSKNAGGFFKTHSAVGYDSWHGVDINAMDFYDLKGSEIPAGKILSTINQVLDVCTTDDQGNFSFDFPTDFFTGPVYAILSGHSFGDLDYSGIVSLKIEVENQKFCSPDVDIFANPGDDIQLEPQVALIKDFDLHLTVLSAYDDDNGDTSQFYKPHDVHAKSIPGGDPIPNAIVKVMRDMQKLGNEHPAVLLAEGEQLGSTSENENGSFKDVFIGKTDVNGEIVIPHLVEHWAVTDGENNSPYFFSIQTRPDNPDSAYENTMYNFEPWFGTLVGMRISTDAGGPTQLDDDAGFTNGAPVVYNHFYSPPQSATDREAYLMAAKPEIKGRLMTVSNMENVPVKYGVIHLYEQMCENCNHAFYDKGFATPNNAGFFRLTNLSVNTDEDLITRGPYRRIYFEHSLYKSFYWPPLDQKALNLRYGDLFFKEFQVEPKQKMRGEVVDDAGNPIASYVRTLPDGPYAKTEPRWEYDNLGNIYKSGEVFETVAGSGSNQIEIQPLSNSYFADTFEVVNPDFHQLHTFKVYRKLHRLKLQLFDNESNGVIANATVIVGDTLAVGHTNSAGVAEIEFASPGEQFLVRVFAENYSPMQEVYNIPVSRQWQEETLRLHYALYMMGTVKESTSGQPIDSALIYSELQNTDGHTLFIQTYSDANGQYRLDGIPWYFTPTDIEVHAVKPGKNPSYIGDKITITVKNSMTMSGFNFRLKAVDGWDLSNIWGFPVTIEDMNFRIQNGTHISGYFYNLPAHSDFNTLNSNEKVYFKNLKVTKGANGEIIPDGNSVFTESYTLPIKIKGGFQGDLSVGNNMQNNTHLTVEKNGDNGLMQGTLQIDLASFGFAYDFSGDLFIGDDTTNINTSVFMSTSGSQHFYNMRHYLFDYHRLLGGGYPVPINNFQVFGFNASSTFDRSYLQDGMIHIGTILHTDISMPNNGQPLDLKIDAGEIQITQNNMEMVHNPGDELAFDLEKWKVVSKNGWIFDKTRDAIVIPNGNIITGLGVDVGIKNLNVRPTALREGVVDMSQGLNLGGIKKLSMASGLEPRFNYDAGVGHYRISMVGTASGPVAWVDNLPATPDRLEFTSIGMLSDNSTVLSLGKTMRFHNLMDIFVDQIMTGDGFFRLGGMPELGIPGYVATRAEVTYTKENGHLKFSLEPLSGGIDCNANTTYTLEQNKKRQTLTNKLFVAYGTFNIKPPPGETGDKLRIQGVLTKTPTECFIDVIHPQTIKMGKESFDIIDGKISVVNGSWNELNYTAHTHSTGLDDQNVLAFTVHGGIEANSDGVKADNIKTPLGDLNIAYLFPESALVGNLTIKKKVEMGFASINSGMMASRFDPHGFYIAFFGDVTMTAQNYLGGFIMGIYDSDLTPVCQTFLSPFRKNPPNLTSLHGIYVIGQRNLADYSFAIPVAPPLFVSFKAGIGAYAHLDYSDPTVVVGGYAFVDATGGYWVPLCSYVGVSANIFLDISGGYQNDVFFLKSCGEVKVGVQACGLEGDLELVNKVRLDSDGNNSFDLGLGNCNNF